MKLKMLSIVVLIIAFTAGDGFAVTIGQWFGYPAADANNQAASAGKLPGTGTWKEALWNKEGIKLPPPPATNKDEIKIIRAKTVCTLDSDAGNYLCKLSIAGGSEEANAPRLEIVNGGTLSIGEFRVGCGGSSSSGPIGCVNQTGGTLNLADNLLIGRFGTSDKNPNAGKGFYTISGGTIAYLPTNAKATLYVGGAGSGATEGTFTIVGSTANISFKKLYIGSDGSNTGCTGTVEFRIGSAGVSPIRIADNISIDLAGAASTAKLVVSAAAEPPKTNILLIENQGSGAVNGVFDTVNGNPAAEGAGVVLNWAGINYNYTLTYKGGQGGNDIMLFYSPAPAVAPAPAAPNTPPAPVAK
ncbi:MAG: hypothetical protein ABSE89_02020 [Sedimentisphaerales bacterium]